LTDDRRLGIITLIGNDFGYCWGWSKDLGPTGGGEIPRHFFYRKCTMKELSIFVDESGDFGAYDSHSPFYVLTMVFHDQAVNISPDLQRLESSLSQRGISNYSFHAGPLIRREDEYKIFNLEERKKMFDYLFNFVRTIDIKYYNIIIEKKHVTEELDLIDRLTKKLSSFLSAHLKSLTDYDRTYIYYDYGQKELAKILITAFNIALGGTEIRNIEPANYKLFQVADMFCTLGLLSEKVDRKMLSKSELRFFTSARNLKKTYLRVLEKKLFK